MLIQIWSDFACPFCFIGKHNLEMAITRLTPEQQKEIQLYFRSYELTPDAPNYTEQTAYEQLAEKYNSSLQRAKALARRATSIANQYGLDFDYDKIVPTNTFKAHQLLHYTMDNEPKKTIQVSRALFDGYLSKGLNLADDATLVEIAKAVELDADAFKEALESEKYANNVRDDEKLAHQMNISSVPFFVIDNESAIAGSQSVDDFHAFLVDYFNNK